MGWRPDRAFASPLLRARESAAIALREAAPDLAAARMAALRPDSDPAAVLEALAAAEASEGHVLLVGHQPLLGLLGGVLTGGPSLALSPGSLVRIEFTGPLAARSGAMGWKLAPGFPD